jgi:hypothetical protein
MAEGSKWTPGKIFLLIVGILGGLALLCCGGLYLLIGEEVIAGIKFGQDSIAFVERLEKDLGAGTTFDIAGEDQSDMAVAIGITGELTPERIAEAQEKGWKALAESYGKNGFFPIKRLGVGTTRGGRKGKGSVSGWTAHVVSVDEIVQRTGVPAPPMVKFLPKDFEKGGGGGFSVQVNGSSDDKEDAGDSGGK